MRTQITHRTADARSSAIIGEEGAQNRERLHCSVTPGDGDYIYVGLNRDHRRKN